MTRRSGKPASALRPQPVTDVQPPDSSKAGSRLTMIGPALLGASSFACADVLSKVALTEGGDVLTVATVRGVLGLAVIYAWLKLAAPIAAARAASPPRWRLSWAWR
jgi:hypothetical protein